MVRVILELGFMDQLKGANPASDFITIMGLDATFAAITLSCPVVTALLFRSSAVSLLVDRSSTFVSSRAHKILESLPLPGAFSSGQRMTVNRAPVSSVSTKTDVRTAVFQQAAPPLDRTK